MKELLGAARVEIVRLRRENELLAAQIGVVEIFAAALGLKRQESAMCPDVVWQLECEIEKLTSAAEHV